MNKSVKEVRAILYLVICLLSMNALGQPGISNGPVTTSKLEFRSSFVLESINFTNTLVGDPFYLRYFQKDYDHFKPLFNAEMEKATARLKDLKERNQFQIASELFLMYSDRLFSPLDTLIYSLDRPLQLNSISYEEFQTMLPDLKLIFSFLKANDFEKYWRDNYYPFVEQRIRNTSGLSADLDIERSISKILGDTVSFEKIVIISYFTKPHGKLKNELIIAQDDLTDKNLLQLIIHETLHAYEASSNREAGTGLHKISEDPFVMKHFQERNPSYNYNTFDGYLEEDIVRVLDQLITEHYGIEKRPWSRFIREDEGMHVLAGALYYLTYREEYSFEDEAFSDFYLRMVLEEKVGPGKFKALYRGYYLKYIMTTPKHLILIIGVSALILILILRPILKKIRQNKVSEK